MSINILGTNQSPKLPTGYLNSAAGDAGIGVPLASPSGSIVQQYLGQLGAKLSVDTAEASALSDPAIGTLFAGVYMYVKFLATSSGSNVRGGLVFWSTASTYVVTPDVTAATEGLIAGVTLSVVTKGNYGWIQIAGRASCKFIASITKVSPVAGDLGVVDQTPTQTVDVLADATGLNSVTAKSIVGVLDNNPTGGAISQINLAAWLNGGRY